MNVAQMTMYESQPGSFHHQSLDHGKPSIRLIQILPDLTTHGRIRCKVTHTTTGSQIVYRCLSYQWGEPNAATSREIEVNGASFTVRKNLYDFLQTLRSNIGHSTLLGTWAAGIWWIDAICIDQQNILERNHQVAQMGNIYSEAEELVVWLGLASLTKNKIRGLLDLAPSGKLPSGIEPDEQRSISLHDRRNIGRRIVHNDYWNRAWITQEIALAQSVSILVDDLLYGFPELLDLLSLVEIPWRHNRLGQFVGIRNGTIDFSTRSLIDLLDHFQDRQCTLPQDRVFSLLSLCSDLGGSIPVDYNMSKDKLAYQIMRSMSDANNGQPRSCSCSSTIVARSLEMRVHPLVAERVATETFLEFAVANLSMSTLGQTNKQQPRIISVRHREPSSVCQDFGLINIEKALHEHVEFVGHYKQSYSGLAHTLVSLPRVLKSYFCESQEFSSASTPLKRFEFSPGCTIELPNEEAGFCLVRIAFRALPTFFQGVTRLCETLSYPIYMKTRIPCDE